MTKTLHPVAKLAEKFEIPEEYHHVLWEAYSEGAKRGFIDASLKGLLGKRSTDLVATDNPSQVKSLESPPGRSKQNYEQ